MRKCTEKCINIFNYSLQRSNPILQKEGVVVRKNFKVSMRVPKELTNMDVKEFVREAILEHKNTLSEEHLLHYIDWESLQVVHLYKQRKRNE